jgi:hypothetical protein
MKQQITNFEKYIRRQDLSRMLARYELFKLQAQVKGCIVECGVHHGTGLMTWAKLSSALEPYALDRRIIGFDTFEGFPSVSEADYGDENSELKVNGLSVDYDIYNELLNCINDYDSNRFLNDFQKVFLVKGDANETIPIYVKENTYMLISLLFMDFDLYEPTKTALINFLPRMSKGSILAFDEINNPWWPGETRALLEELNINNYKIQKFSFDPNISYIQL